MKSENERKEIDAKNRTCCYFDDIITGTKTNDSNILLDKKLYENMIFLVTIKWVQNHCVLGLIK